MRVRCVGAVILDDVGRLLVVRRMNAPSADLWSVPGGRIELGESPREAVTREVREETGLVVTVDALLGSVEIPAEDSTGTVYDVEDYACTVVQGGELLAGDDAAEVRWVDRAAFDALA